MDKKTITFGETFCIPLDITTGEALTLEEVEEKCTTSYNPKYFELYTDQNYLISPNSITLISTTLPKDIKEKLGIKNVQ